MVARHHDHNDLVSIQWTYGNPITLSNRHPDERELELAGKKPVQIHLRVAGRHLEFDRGVSRTKLTKNGGRKPHVPQGQIRNAQMTCQSRGVILHLSDGPILFMHKRPSVCEESFACCCQPHLPRISLEKLNPEVPFQALNPQGEGGLREIEARGRPAEVPLLRDCQKPPYIP